MFSFINSLIYFLYLVNSNITKHCKLLYISILLSVKNVYTACLFIYYNNIGNQESKEGTFTDDFTHFPKLCKLMESFLDNCKLNFPVSCPAKTT